MNPYKNMLQKVKVLLKEDDNLTKKQCTQHQWQLLAKVSDGYTFTVGKGGVNTIFYSASSEERLICYPEEMVALLEDLSKGKIFAYLALDKNKKPLVHSVHKKLAKRTKRAAFLAVIDFEGNYTIKERKEVDLYGKKVWQSLKKKKS